MNATWLNSNFKIQATPLSQAIIEFEIDIVKRFDTNNDKFVDGTTFKLIINFRECRSGEYYDKQKNYCEKC